MNKVILIGRLTKDPETRFTGSGDQVTQFTLAVNRPYNRDKADFIQCVCWKKTAEIATKYLKKGDQCGVDGELNIDQHEGKYYTKVNVRQLELLGGGGKKEEDDFPMIPDEDVPF